MGLILGGHLPIVASGVADVVTLSAVSNWGATDSDLTGPYDTVIGIRVNSAGTWEKYEATNDALGVYTPISPSTDWINNKGSAPGAYQVQCTVGVGAPNFNSDVTGSFLALTSTRQWYRQRTASGNETVTWTIAIRLGTGATLASRLCFGTIDNGGV